MPARFAVLAPAVLAVCCHEEVDALMAGTQTARI